MRTDQRSGVAVTETSEAELRLQERIRQAQQEAVSEVLLPTPSPDLLQRVIEDADGFAEAATAKHLDPASPPVACSTGCSHCCYQLVSVSAPEVFRIVRYLRTSMPRVQMEEVVGRVRSLDKATRGASSKARVNIKKPCAFLDADGSCTIYAVRPLACSEFTSYDVQACKRGKRIGFKPFGLIHEKARMIAFNAVRQGLQDGLAIAVPQAGTNLLELTAAISTALDHPAPEQAWLSGENVFVKSHLNQSRNR